MKHPRYKSIPITNYGDVILIDWVRVRASTFEAQGDKTAITLKYWNEDEPVTILAPVKFEEIETVFEEPDYI